MLRLHPRTFVIQDCKLAELAHSSTFPDQGLPTTGGAEPTFRVLHRDEVLVAVAKPNRLLVHRTDIDFHERWNLRDLVNAACDDAIRQPLHRLDKPTSGIVLFATAGEAFNRLKLEFVHRRTTKVYWAIVRGWTEDEGVVEKPLPTAHNPAPKEARTRYRTLARVELPHPVGPYETARYSLVECRPETGRFHQIRLHFRHLRHPIVGDSRYGDKAHNRFVASTYGVDTLLLHAGRLDIHHPHDEHVLSLQCAVPDAWLSLLADWPWEGSCEEVPREDRVEAFPAVKE